LTDVELSIENKRTPRQDAKSRHTKRRTTQRRT